MATVGTITTSRRVSTSRRAFTNWLGKRALSSLGKRALRRTVPVVGSTWLSMAARAPRAMRFRRSRSQASTGSRPSLAVWPSTRWMLSAGTAKTTLMGCRGVMVARPPASVARTMLPASTSRRPTRPEVGAVMRLYTRLSLALSTAAWSALRAASYWVTAAFWVSSCCRERMPCSTRVWKRFWSAMALSRTAWSLASWPSACMSWTWKGRGSISASRSPSRTIWPSVKATRRS